MVWCCCSAKRADMVRMGRSSDELKDKCLFVCCRTDDEVIQIGTHGITVNPTSFSSLGQFSC